jgi:hypothetical protein
VPAGGTGAGLDGTDQAGKYRSVDARTRIATLKGRNRIRVTAR